MNQNGYREIRCRAVLHRCCGQGTLRCELQEGHYGLHVADDYEAPVEWG